jgi:signal transduction histidine kinase
MQSESNRTPAVPRELDRVERLFAKRSSLTRAAFEPVCARARERAIARLQCMGEGEQGRHDAALVFAGELFGAIVVELGEREGAAAELPRELEEIAGLPRLSLAREVLRAPQLDALAPGPAAEVALELLLALAPLRNAALWTRDAAGHIRCAKHAGEGTPSGAMRKVAHALLAGEAIDAGADGELLAMPVECSQAIAGALLARAEPGQRRRGETFMREALPMLAATVERDGLLARNAASERALVEASERRLTRLGFDLHDGPLQDLVLLGEDLRLLRGQLGRLSGAGEEQLLRGRLDDIEAQLVALEAALRGIATSAHATVLTSRPFATALNDVIEVFAARCEIRPRVSLEGELGSISPSQHIALLSVVQEALSNVREHSKASSVTVSVALEPSGVRAQVTDDGCGFDVEAALVSAASRGRIGLAGMHERIRLLGGECRLDSRLGGPTVISITLPLWQPLASEPAPGVVVAV